MTCCKLGSPKFYAPHHCSLYIKEGETRSCVKAINKGDHGIVICCSGIMANLTIFGYYAMFSGVYLFWNISI